VTVHDIDLQTLSGDAATLGDFAGSTIRVRASYAAGQITTPKSGKVRAVPMAPDVASALAPLSGRGRFTGDDDFVFAGEAGLPLDGDALSSRYRDALARGGLRPLRFHDLRHTFGTRMIRKADIRRVQEWMGHADIQTTMKYLHYESRPEDAACCGGVRLSRVGERRALAATVPKVCTARHRRTSRRPAFRR